MRIGNVQLFNRNYLSKYSTFKGYVNGHYYEDSIIEAAKKAFKNPHWRDELLAKKVSVGKAISSWHNNDSAGLPARILFGIASMGLTEVGFGIMSSLDAIRDNQEIDDMIQKIERCMRDFGNRV